ncbi:MAG: tetratricopeptide repeat protein [Planctomycetota bacterium]|jgi:tetratricopeptide (TPR) repeat protein
MTAENTDNILENNRSEAHRDPQPSAAEVGEDFPDANGPTSGTEEELSAREIFVGDENFYKSLDNSGQQRITPPRFHQSAATHLSAVPSRARRLSILQKVLAAGIIAVSAILIYGLVKPRLESGRRIRSPHFPEFLPPAATSAAEQPSPAVEPLVAPVPEAEIHAIPYQEAAPAALSTQPLSLKIAETFFLNREYEKAYSVYDQLRQSLMTGGEEELLGDFLRLQMAICIKETLNAREDPREPDKVVEFYQAGRLLRSVLQSRSPAIRVLANYHLSILEMHRRQYLQARTRAYQAVALIGALGTDTGLVSSLQRDCHFLIAESITRDLLSLCDADKNLPKNLWNKPDSIDPFTHLDEAQLRSLLTTGSENLRKGLLSPHIQKLESSRASASQYWLVACQAASIDELLARFASKAGLDICWAAHNGAMPAEAGGMVRERPVSLFMPMTAAQELMSIAAGSVGLLALPDSEGVISVCNPADYSSLSEHTALLCQEAISLWQRFLLVHHDDDRAAKAHFATALVQAQAGNISEAIAEYRLVANRFSQKSLAPFAMLYSSKLKAGIHDYAGARDDLKLLVEQYPDIDFLGRACLYLAEVTMKSGLKTEAARLYRKVHHLGISSELQAASALGAGRCFYEIGDFQEAAGWLSRYIGLAKDNRPSDLHSAYLLLGKAGLALGKPGQACNAFQHALTKNMTREEYVETLSALVEAQIQHEQYVEALNALENVRSWQLSPEQLTDILVLKAKVLRSMGLIDKVVTTLGEREQYSPDLRSRARISFELAKCWTAKSEFESAHRKLTEILVYIEPGPLAQEVALELAYICLKLNQDSLAASICSQLLDSDLSPQIEHRVQDLLATAYERQKNYDRAVRALLGRRDGAEDADKRNAEAPPAVADSLLQPNKTEPLMQHEN